MRILSGRTAVITGGGSGIGRATALALADRGCHIAVVDINAGDAEATAELVRKRNRRASAHSADVRDLDRMLALPAEVLDSHGDCHILVNNAGVTTAGRFSEDSMDDVRWIVDINLWGVVHGCRAFIPTLTAAGEAHIVNLSSMVGLLGLPGNAAYSLSKGAVRSFTEALRGELAPQGIGVTAVFPGAINTNIMANARGSSGEQIRKAAQNPLAKHLLRSPESVANSIVGGIERDRARVVVGPDAHVVSVISRLLPGRNKTIGRLTALAERRQQKSSTTD
jgi:NAD(P)-dependent dehydrogenase (short-subunit alcohol dehydrogenase family)